MPGNVDQLQRRTNAASTVVDAEEEPGMDAQNVDRTQAIGAEIHQGRSRVHPDSHREFGEPSLSLLIVTPIHNEEANIGVLADQLASSTRQPDLWVIVDDGSTDAGAAVVRAKELPFETVVLERKNAGGLIGGSAFTAWQFGVDHAIGRHPDFSHIMKLDADVELPPSYLETALKAFKRDPKIGLVGGVLLGKRDREQTIHVPGPVKLYSADAYMALSEVPRRVGFDVMDELAIKSKELIVEVRKDLPFTVRRAIGASQGLVHGRRRNGVVCRWTGYWGPYFVLHAIRYLVRKPYIVGSGAMIYGYIKSSPGPYPPELKQAHAAEQKAKLLQALRRPRSWVRETYGIEP